MSIMTILVGSTNAFRSSKSSKTEPKSLTPRTSCNSHGIKVDGECLCLAGFSGEQCEVDTCDDKKKCNGHGICKENICSCFPGYEGDDCSIVTECESKDCSSHGICKYGSCFCHPGFEGDDCSKVSQCETLDKCNGNGVCVENTCQCSEGWTGDTCSEMTSKKPCPNDCNGGNGECRDGVCWCLPGYGNDDCSSVMKCPGGAEGCGRGICAFGKCHCHPDWTLGEKGTCSKKKTCGDDEEGPDCSGHGSCFDSKCYCSIGFEGELCNVQSKCPNDCSHRGICDQGKCVCAPGYTGEDCSLDVQRVREEERLKQCSEGCSGHGICGYNMLDFNTGEPLSRCLCSSGWAGEFCEVALQCKDSCNGRGECVNSKCVCNCGYSGEACERVALASDACPKDCFGGGECVMGQCFCHPGREGSLCEKIKACPGNTDGKSCSGNGVCQFGKCFCRKGFSGDACEVEPEVEKASMRFSSSTGIVDEVLENAEMEKTSPPPPAPTTCLNSCNNHGICRENRCICDAGFSGLDCGNAEDPRLTNELPALRSSEFTSSSKLSQEEEEEEEGNSSKNASNISTTAATFASFFTFLVGVAIGTVAMWYKHKRTRSRALKYLAEDNNDNRESLMIRYEEKETMFNKVEQQQPELPPMPPIPRN